MRTDPNPTRTRARPPAPPPRACAKRLPRALRLVLLLGALLLAALPAGAQSYFPESDTLRPDTALELLYSKLANDSVTKVNAVPVETSNVDSSLLRLEGRLRRGVLAAGAMTESRQYHEITDTFDVLDERRQSAAYAALALESLLADDDQFYLVLSTSRRHERFAYSGYQRYQDYDVGLQTGIVYRLSFVVAGYVRGDETLGLRVTDTVLGFVQERYRYQYTAWLAGILLGDPKDLGLALVYQRKDTPAVPGTSVNLEEGREQLQRVSLTLGQMHVDYSQSRVREAFTGAAERESAEREFALGYQFNERLRVGISQKRVDDQQGFTSAGVPATGSSERTENQLRVQLRF